MKSKGFTLIELLVVISIIGLLASVVLVSLNGARIKARDARRIADLKQITTALELYASDNGYYPSTGSVAGGAAAWACFDCQNSIDNPIYNPSNPGVSLGNLKTVMSPYIQTPKDPKNPGYPGSGYLYTSDGSSYKIDANRGPEDLRNYPIGMLDSVRCGGINPSTGQCNAGGTGVNKNGGVGFNTEGFWTSPAAAAWD